MRKLYYSAPRLAVAPLLDARVIPVWARKAGGLVGRGAEEAARDGAVSTLACRRCHGVHSLSRVRAGAWWNEVVGYLTGGLLYGREVERPGWVVEGEAGRKMKYSPRLARGAPKREAVRARLVDGWTKGEIARELGISVDCVEGHMRLIFRQEGVRDRHGLAAKCGSGRAQPLNKVERARERRARVLGMMVEGRTYKEMMRELGVGFSTVNRDVVAIYRGHGVSSPRVGKGAARAALVERVLGGVAG